MQPAPIHPNDIVAHLDSFELTEPRATATPDAARLSHDSDDNMAINRPSFHRPTSGRSSEQLLKDDERRFSRSSFENGDAEGRPMLHADRHHSRRSTMQSIDPAYDAAQATRKKYMIAGGFLLLSLASFVVQTETAVYIQQDLGWKKPYCML